jgi:hypothetical protein
MKVSELLADLKNRADQAQVIVIESDAVDKILTIESVVKESNEKAVVLMGKSGKNRTFDEALVRGSNERHSIKILESGDQFQVSIDGSTLLPRFETPKDAKLFVQGYTVGFSVGSGSVSK